MKRVASLLVLGLCCVALASCTLAYGAWGAAYRYQGGYYDRPKKSTLKTAAAQLERLAPRRNEEMTATE